MLNQQKRTTQQTKEISYFSGKHATVVVPQWRYWRVVQKPSLRAGESRGTSGEGRKPRFCSFCVGHFSKFVGLLGFNYATTQQKKSDSGFARGRLFVFCSIQLVANTLISLLVVFGWVDSILIADVRNFAGNDRLFDVGAIIQRCTI